MGQAQDRHQEQLAQQQSRQLEQQLLLQKEQPCGGGSDKIVVQVPQLKTWMQEVGIIGKKLDNAMAVCQEQDIETMADLELLHRNDLLHDAGFK